MAKKVKAIWNRKELLKLKEEIGVRSSWHEPDEQGITAEVFGDWNLDNSAASGLTLAERELTVRLYKDEKPIADVNLAMLFAWATGYEDED